MKSPGPKLHRSLLLLMAVILSPVGAKAQDSYKQTASKVTIAGTSTMNDWSMSSKESIYTAIFKVDVAGKPVGLSSLVLTIPVESLKSGDVAMDKSAYAALKTDVHKFITFQLLSGKMDGHAVRWNGKLTIAGVSRVVDLEASYIVNADHSILIEGSKELDIRAFGVVPPTFMLGSAKVGEKVTVSFNVALAPKASPVVSALKTSEL